jgi:hypothetical protein
MKRRNFSKKKKGGIVVSFNVARRTWSALCTVVDAKGAAAGAHAPQIYIFF